MGGGSSQQTYQVPWKLITPQEPVKEGLAVYWFPTGKAEVDKSSLRESRTLQLYSQQCVTMGIVDPQTALGQKYVPDGKLPVAVLVQADGTVVNKLENKDGQAQGWRSGKAGGKRDEEARVRRERKDGSRQGQGQIWRQPGGNCRAETGVEQKCMFPGKAKDAVKELKKLGVTDLNAEAMPDGPNFDAAVSARIQKNDVDGPDGGKMTPSTRWRRSITRPRTTLIRTILRRCATWASCIGTTRASGTKRARPSTRSWP